MRFSIVGRLVFKSRKIALACRAASLIITSASVAVELGKPAPEFTLKDFKGESKSLSNYRGKTILINFWATWCVPCLKEIPDLVKLQRSIKSPFTVLGIAVASGEPDDVEQFAKDHGMNYPILLDPDQRAYQKFRLIGLPASFLVDRKGLVAKSYVGPHTYERFMADIRAVLKP